MALKIKTLAGLVNAALHIKTGAGIVPVNLHAKTADGIVLLSGGPAPYTGALATRAFFPDTIDTARYQYMTETRHVVRAASDVIGIVEANSYSGANNAEVAPGAAMTVTASVSKSQTGTRTQITFGGVASGTVPNGGKLESDLIDFPVSPGDVLYIRRWRSCSSGIVCNADTIKGGSDICLRGTTTADLTMSTSAMTGGVTACSWPVAVIGTIVEPSVGVIGDSRAYGRGDTMDADYELGEVCRSIGPAFGYVNLSRRTMSPAQYTASNTLRNQLLDYVSHIVCDFGINSFINESKTYAQAKSELEAVWAGFSSGKPIFQTTLSPVSTGAWTLTDFSDQTVAWGDRLPQMNDYLRTAPSPLAAVFEIADVVESSRNSGKWKAPGYTTDGTHGSQTACVAIKNSGVIDTSLISR